jgi:hypothetical protein
LWTVGLTVLEKSTKEHNIESIRDENPEKNTWIREKREQRNTQSIELFNEAVTTAEVPEW